MPALLKNTQLNRNCNVVGLRTFPSYCICSVDCCVDFNKSRAVHKLLPMCGRLGVFGVTHCFRVMLFLLHFWLNFISRFRAKSMVACERYLILKICWFSTCVSFRLKSTVVMESEILIKLQVVVFIRLFFHYS